MAVSSKTALKDLFSRLLQDDKPGLKLNITEDLGDLLSFHTVETAKNVRFTESPPPTRKSKTPKPQQSSLTLSTRNENLYNRGQDFLRRKAEKIDNLRLHEFTFQPLISRESVRLAGKTQRSPLHQVKPKTPPPPPEIQVKEQHEKLDLEGFISRNYTKQLAGLTARKEPRPEPVDKECTFHPNVNGKSAELAGHRKTSLYEREMKSQADLQKRRAALAKSRDELIMRECTFTPRSHK